MTRSDDGQSQVLAELDARHHQAREALKRRSLSGYEAMFAPSLTYRQADGRIIDRDRLMRDYAVQLRPHYRFDSSFAREHFECEDDQATEILTQTGSITATGIFFVVHRTWEVDRRLKYTWEKQEGRWLVVAVEVLEERVSPARVSFGLQPPPDRVQ